MWFSDCSCISHHDTNPCTRVWSLYNQLDQQNFVLDCFLITRFTVVQWTNSSHTSWENNFSLAELIQIFKLNRWTYILLLVIVEKPPADVQRVIILPRPTSAVINWCLRKYSTIVHLFRNLAPTRYITNTHLLSMVYKHYISPGVSMPT